jgi:hypothetical protein
MLAATTNAIGYRAGQRADIVGRQIVSREHGGDFRHPARRFGVDGADARMRMR